MSEKLERYETQPIEHMIVYVHNCLSHQARLENQGNSSQEVNDGRI